MARGWESKSVEEQMTNAVEHPIPNREGKESDEDRRVKELKRLDTARQKAALNLQRENILSQKTSNPARRQALEAALAQVEAQIETLQ
jgi:hypothetical protein